MTKQSKRSGNEQRTVANCAVVRVARGISTTDDPEEWVVQAGSIRAGLRMPFSCIQSATTMLSETDQKPTDWAGWWIKRLTLSKSLCACTTGGGSSPAMVSYSPDLSGEV